MSMQLMLAAVARLKASGGGVEWNISGASYDSKTKNVSAQSTVPDQVWFKSDGTKMYIGHASYTIYQYSLSTAWDVSTASYDSVSYNASGGSTGNMRGFCFSGDGTKLITAHQNAQVYQHSLSAAWDLSTASYDSVSLTVTGQTGGAHDPGGVFVGNSGSTLFLLAGIVNAAIYQYTLSTPWDLSSASYASKSFAVGSQDSNPTDLFIKDDGTRLFVVGYTSDTIYQYTMSTAWDVSTASYDSVSFSVSSEESTPRGLFWKPDGSKFYVCGSASDSVYQYSSGI